mmetsp:Transcript_45476/g.131663  ORF Transcript_45476/g.131663 Transcript_45476/m.131663 type:complete len:201 (-) Transcript_45476:406-1008(-)
MYSSRIGLPWRVSTLHRQPFLQTLPPSFPCRTGESTSLFRYKLIELPPKGTSRPKTSEVPWSRWISLHFSGSRRHFTSMERVDSSIRKFRSTRSFMSHFFCSSCCSSSSISTSSMKTSSRSSTSCSYLGFWFGWQYVDGTNFPSLSMSMGVRCMSLSHFMLGRFASRSFLISRLQSLPGVFLTSSIEMSQKRPPCLVIVQ